MPLLSGSSSWLSAIVGWLRRAPAGAGAAGAVAGVECRGGVVGLRLVSRVLPLCSSVCVLVDGGVPSPSWLRSIPRIPNSKGPFSAPAVQVCTIECRVHPPRPTRRLTSRSAAPARESVQVNFYYGKNNTKARAPKRRKRRRPYGAAARARATRSEIRRDSFRGTHATRYQPSSNGSALCAL